MPAIEFRPVTNADASFLYKLLGERDPATNISHRCMPTFEGHEAFIASSPYPIWNTIWNYSGPIGSVYLTAQNEIGLFLAKEWQGIGIGGKALRLFCESNPRDRYLANITPGNEQSKAFFMAHGFKHIQNTYELRVE
jgi:RimJ/RimL family protein N-acetyltransferase